MPMGERIREQARICAQVSGNEEIARIASLSEVAISLEHLRGLDPGTRIVCGYGFEDSLTPNAVGYPAKKAPSTPRGSSRVPSARQPKAHPSDICRRLICESLVDAVLAAMLAKRAPGYTGLGFPDPRRLCTHSKRQHGQPTGSASHKISR